MRESLEARRTELEAQLAKLRDQGLMISGALAEVRRQLELPDVTTGESTGDPPAVEPVDFKSAQRRGS